MSKLPKFTLSYDEKRENWALKEDGASRAKARFDTKSEATKGGALEEALGRNGGSVKIQRTDGQFQEERTFRVPRTPNRRKASSVGCYGLASTPKS